MKVIGLTGGIASGKSAVAQALAQHGAVVLDADQFAHDVLREPRVIEQLQNRWGTDVLDSQGAIDRQAVARIVFAEDEAASKERGFLESLVHPLVRSKIAEQIEERLNAGADAVVLDVPLLIEAGWADLCDAIYFIDSPFEERLARARLRGWSEEEFRRREQAQLPLDEKQAAASSTLENSKSPAHLQGQVEKAWQEFFAE